jgi:hypothetical protein
MRLLGSHVTLLRQAHMHYISQVAAHPSHTHRPKPLPPRA